MGLRTFAVAAVLYAAASVGAQQSDPVIAQILNDAYALRRAGRADSAARLFAVALSRDSSNARVARELGYSLLAADRVPDAIAAFQTAARSEPKDATLQLQLGYAYEQVGDHHAALRSFTAAAGAADTLVRKPADASIHVLAGRWYASRGTTIVDWYEGSSVGTRFHNFVGSGDLHAALLVEPTTRGELYLVGHVIRDTRTRGGEQPVIFSDNYFGVGVGARARPFPVDLTLYAEAGPTTSLTTGGRSGVDARAGATFGTTWTRTGSPYSAETYADASYYSRYRDAIGYAQLRQSRSIPNVRWLDVFLREAGTADANGVAYNNLVEGGAGIRVRGSGRVYAYLALEGVGGAYTRGAVAGRSTFTELRATLAASGYSVFTR